MLLPHRRLLSSAMASASPVNVVEVSDKDGSLKSLKSVLDGGAGGKLVLFFYADWHDESRQLFVVLTELQKKIQEPIFLVDGEKFAELSVRFRVQAIPTLVVVAAANKAASQPEKVLVNLGDFDVPSLVKAVETACTPRSAAAAAAAPASGAGAGAGSAAASSSSSSSSSSASVSEADKKEALHKRCRDLVNSNKVMLFIKGTPDKPRCGFSGKAVRALKEAGGPSLTFGSFDILEDDDVADGLCEVYNWPTYPQLYINGELVGGCDVMSELHAAGELKEMLDKAGASGGAAPAAAAADKKAALHKRCRDLVNSNKVMLFIKGTPDKPRCGFSGKAVRALKEAGGPSLTFGSFDILEDDDVADGLCEVYNWPTYPQLYINGELVGGCDVMSELHAAGELKEMLDKA